MNNSVIPELRSVIPAQAGIQFHADVSRAISGFQLALE